jgi:phosphomannomutase
MSAITIEEIMQTSNVKFGTSGARGLVRDMTDAVCYAYTLGFIQYLRATDQLIKTDTIALAGDLRSSTPAILNACSKAILNSGLKVLYAGKVPTPAIALYGLQHHCASIMVTGSHIPDDRNGIKFYKLGGEILKADEIQIKQQAISLPDGLFDDNGRFTYAENYLPNEDAIAAKHYQQRFIDLFPEQALHGIKVGVYQHSGVAREMLAELLETLGAEVVRLGFSDQFVPVDTEAVRAEDVDLAKQWVRQYQLDAIVSTDGDADRPLISDEQGNWLRGDIVGILCARYLGIDHVVAPISCNTCLEKSNWFSAVKRTRIGSPYVITGMNEYVDDHYLAVAGYEANGGFLQATSLRKNHHVLSPLPTRDALIVIFTVLHSAKQQNMLVSQLSASLPKRFTYSDRIKNFASEKGRQLIAKYTSGSLQENKTAIQIDLPQFGEIVDINSLDGLRITFANEDIIHFRPSGNAPEFRCYSESDSLDKAQLINKQALSAINKA